MSTSHVAHTQTQGGESVGLLLLFLSCLRSWDVLVVVLVVLLLVVLVVGGVRFTSHITCAATEVQVSTSGQGCLEESRGRD